MKSESQLAEVSEAGPRDPCNVSCLPVGRRRPPKQERASEQRAATEDLAVETRTRAKCAKSVKGSKELPQQDLTSAILFAFGLKQPVTQHKKPTTKPGQGRRSSRKIHPQVIPDLPQPPTPQHEAPSAKHVSGSSTAAHASLLKTELENAAPKVSPVLADTGGHTTSTEDTCNNPGQTSPLHCAAQSDPAIQHDVAVRASKAGGQTEGVPAELEEAPACDASDESADVADLDWISLNQILGGVDPTISQQEFDSILMEVEELRGRLSVILEVSERDSSSGADSDFEDAAHDVRNGVGEWTPELLSECSPTFRSRVLMAFPGSSHRVEFKTPTESDEEGELEGECHTPEETPSRVETPRRMDRTSRGEGFIGRLASTQYRHSELSEDEQVEQDCEGEMGGLCSAGVGDHAVVEGNSADVDQFSDELDVAREELADVPLWSRTILSTRRGIVEGPVEVFPLQASIGDASRGEETVSVADDSSAAGEDLGSSSCALTTGGTPAVAADATILPTRRDTKPASDSWKRLLASLNPMLPLGDGHQRSTRVGPEAGSAASAFG